MNDDRHGAGDARGKPDEVEKTAARRPWQTPRVLWTGEIQTLAYQCSSGPAPVSGSPTEGCPP